MVQIIQENKRPTFGQQLNEGLGRGLETLQQYQQMAQQEAKQQKFADEVQRLYGVDVSSMSPEGMEKFATEAYKQQSKQNQLQEKQDFLEKLFGQQQPQKNPKEVSEEQPMALNISDEDIIQASAIDPNLARELRNAKDTALKEKNRSEELKSKKFEQERTYHTGFSKELEKDVNQKREALPKKEMALNFARNAIETGNLGFFSLDKLADITGSDLFRTSKGAQLVTAAKENLLGNMGRVSARAQNIWFEQRLNSMFPKIGQSDQANLTVQEMIEGEVAMDKAYINEFDRLVKEDEDKYGFTLKDIGKRAQNAASSQQKQIFNRSVYRMKELEEKEKGVSKLRKEVGKNVIKGTPLTLGMAQLYVDKFGKEKAMEIAKKNGYFIPSRQDYQYYEIRPEEYRERLE